MQGLLLVGAGGALGAMGRYGISQLPWKGAFPLWTLCVNFLGAVAIGLLSGLFAGKLLGERGKLFWQTGVCGGFTTFSTFSLEAVELFQQGRPALAGLYVLLGVALCVGGVLLGQALSRAVL